MCKKRICDCVPVTDFIGPGPFFDDDIVYESDDSYASDSSSNEDWWNEPEPITGRFVSNLASLRNRGIAHPRRRNEQNANVQQLDRLPSAETVSPSNNTNVSENNPQLVPHPDVRVTTGPGDNLSESPCEDFTQIEEIGEESTCSSEEVAVKKRRFNEEEDELLENFKHAAIIESDQSPVNSETDTANKTPNTDVVVNKILRPQRGTYNTETSGAGGSNSCINECGNEFRSIVVSDVNETNGLNSDTDNAETCTNNIEINEIHSTSMLENITKTEENKPKRTVINWEKEMNLIAAHKKTDSFEGILMEFRGHDQCISREDIKFLEVYARELDVFYGRNQAVEKFSEPTHTLVKFALYLDLNCPSAYDFLIENYNTPLPSRKGLSKWYLEELGRPGLAKKSFEILKHMASRRRLTCTLKWYIVKLLNSKLDYKYDKFMVRDFKISDEAEVQTFVFELTSIDENWRIPVGFFYAESVPVETHAAFIRACLTQCYEAGVDVVAVTFNTASPAELLGCSFNDIRNLKTTFKHPASDQDVAAWIDPHASFKSVYQTLKCKFYLYAAGEGKVRWNLIRKLRKLYSKSIVSFEEDYAARNFDRTLELHNHVAKVGLTSATMSRSLVSALATGQGLLPDWFKDTAPTQHFIETFNSLYDTLRSGPNVQDAIGDNSFEIFFRLDQTKTYILDIFSNEENELSKKDVENFDEYVSIPSFMEGDVISGFIGFLVTIESLKFLFDTLVIKEKKMSRLFTSRLCRDQSRCVFLKPSMDMIGHFVSRYEELSRRNSLGSELVSIIKKWMGGRMEPFSIIRATADRRAFDSDQQGEYRQKRLSVTIEERRATENMQRYSRLLGGEMILEVKKCMVGYLAGWIAATYARCLKCEECIDLLLSGKKQWFHKYIPRKEMKWMCLPSEGLFRVCWECERAIKRSRTSLCIGEDVFANLSIRSPWSARPERHHWTHPTLLIHLIITKYSSIRKPKPKPRNQFETIQQMINLLERFSQFRDRIHFEI